MSQVNERAVGPRTKEGGPAVSFSPEKELRRAVACCMLWEDNFYESGQAIGDRIGALVKKVPQKVVADLAREARTKMKLRHAPLLLTLELIKQGDNIIKGVDHAELVEDVCQRADEPAELLSMYWKGGKRSIPAALKRGLAAALTKFDAYQVAKYKGDGKAVKFKDVLFMTHAKPKDEEQAEVWKKLVAGTLESPDTWEVSLSAGKDKKETWERLMSERKLGYLALLRNLRNMTEAGVRKDMIENALLTGNASRVLPFRFIAAARACPSLEPTLDTAMQRTMEGMQRLAGRTCLLVDVSGSMGGALSGKSDLNRLDAAKGLAILLRGVCDDIDVYRFDTRLELVPARRGMALADAIGGVRGGTMLGSAVESAKRSKYDRFIVITDEQSADAVGASGAKISYMINVAGYKNGVGYGDWNRIEGFSESVVDWMMEFEGKHNEPEQGM